MYELISSISEIEMPASVGAKVKVPLIECAFEIEVSIPTLKRLVLAVSAGWQSL